MFTKTLSGFPEQAGKGHAYQERFEEIDDWKDFYRHCRWLSMGSFVSNFLFHAGFYWYLSMMSSEDITGALGLLVHTVPTVATGGLVWSTLHRGSFQKMIWACRAHLVALHWAAFRFVYLILPRELYPQALQTIIDLADPVPVYGKNIASECEELDGSFGADPEWQKHCQMSLGILQMSAAWIGLLIIVVEYCLVRCNYLSCADQLNEMRRQRFKKGDVEMAVRMDEKSADLAVDEAEE